MLMFYLSALETEEDRNRFEQLYYANRAVMMKSAKSILHDDSLAEDVVHDVFLVAIDKVDKLDFRDCNKLRSLLVHSVKNRAIDYLRKRRHEKLLEDDEDHTIEHITDKQNVEDIVFNKESLSALMEVVNSMSETYRSVLVLQAQGFSTAEIATWFGITENNVRVRLYRAREQAKKRYSQAVAKDTEEGSVAL